MITIIYENTDCITYFCQVCRGITNDHEAHERSVWHQINLAFSIDKEEVTIDSVVVIDVTSETNINDRREERCGK